MPALSDHLAERADRDPKFGGGGIHLGLKGLCLFHALDRSVNNHTRQEDSSHSQTNGGAGYHTREMDVNEIFRLRLQAEMQAQGLNPASLSLKANLNRRAVTDLLEGRAQSPKVSTAYALATALGVGLDQLTGLAPQVSIAPRLAELLAQYSPDEQEQLADAILALPRAPGSRH